MNYENNRAVKEEVVMDTEPLVMVRCLCYNHSKYLREALDGIVKQKTNFPFVAIVHDDCSTDDSQSIIREYENNYPNIIRGIYQKENQYKKGVKITKEIIEPLMKAKYTAVCECDDYWTDESKLQTQVDYMETHSECSMCYHCYDTVSSDKKLITHYGLQGSGNHVIPVEDVIINENPIQLATVVYRQKLRNQMPEYFYNAMVGDYPLYVYMATKGEIYYIDKVMSAYRRHGNNSWVTRMNKKPMAYRKHVNSLIEMMNRFDEETGYQLHSTVENRIENCKYQADRVEGNITNMIHNRYFKSLPLEKKFSSICKALLNKKRVLKI